MFDIYKGCFQFEGKDKVMVFDYVIPHFPMLERMYKKRSKGYEAMGYTITEKEKSRYYRLVWNWVNRHYKCIEHVRKYNDHVMV